MPWNEYLLPIMAGYLFFNIFYLTKFRAQHHDGYRLLIESTIIGAGIFTGARVFLIWTVHRYPQAVKIQQTLVSDGITYPFFGTAIAAAAVAVGAAMALNLLIGTERAKKLIVKDHDNGFLRVFHRAAIESLMVSVTLSNRKVYIGYVLKTPNFTPEQQFVALLPLLSGYRDKDTLQLEITTNYVKVISANPRSAPDFAITFAIDTIDCANLFDPVSYQLFRRDPNNPEQPQNDTKPLPPGQ